MSLFSLGRIVSRRPQNYSFACEQNRNLVKNKLHLSGTILKQWVAFKKSISLKGGIKTSNPSFYLSRSLTPCGHR